MRRCSEVIAPDDDRITPAALTATLPREQRYRRRIRITLDDGAPVLLDFAETLYLPHGAGLLLDDGAVVRIIAAEERVYEIVAPTPGALLRLAWHLGNRHTACEITAEALYIAPDHVIAEMIRALGGKIRETRRIFEPEGGAFGGPRMLGRDHEHEHDHAGPSLSGHGHAAERGDDAG